MLAVTLQPKLHVLTVRLLMAPRLSVAGVNLAPSETATTEHFLLMPFLVLPRSMPDTLNNIVSPGAPLVRVHHLFSLFFMCSFVF